MFEVYRVDVRVEKLRIELVVASLFQLQVLDTAAYLEQVLDDVLAFTTILS